MNSKYLFFIVIPALFIAVSCAREAPKIEEFLTFSSEKKEVGGKNKVENIETAEVVEEVEEPAAQKIAGESFNKRYNIGYLTFDVADLYAEMIPLEKNGDYTRYRFRFYSKTNGFVDYVFGWMSYTSSVMRVYDNKVVPEIFKSKVTLKKKTREIELDYDNLGKNIILEIVTPPDNRFKRPAVLKALKSNTFDPLSIVIETRRIVMSAVRNNRFDANGLYNFSLPLYDGRKRTAVNFELRKKKVNDMFVLKFTMEPVAGYTNNELADIKKGERIITLYIDPENFTPVSAVGKSPIGSARAKWLEDCGGTLENCVKKNTKKK